MLRNISEVFGYIDPVNERGYKIDYKSILGRGQYSVFECKRDNKIYAIKIIILN